VLVLFVIPDYFAYSLLIYSHFFYPIILPEFRVGTRNACAYLVQEPQ
jgi:hypothetical protein